MRKTPAKIPTLKGQLVWCPSDPALGVGLVLAHDSHVLRVKFLRLQEERHYTTRVQEVVVARYEVSHNERVATQHGGEARVKRRQGAFVDHALAFYELDDGRVLSESELVPAVRDIGAKERLANLTLGHPEVVRARLLGLELKHVGMKGGVAQALGTRVQWLPHQIDVATRALSQAPVRLLLADEVGLGKTVEAAMIFAGLRAQGRAERVLILAPDQLCIQWLGEIFRKAHELIVLFDRTRIQDARHDFADINPAEAHRRLVVSLDQAASDPELNEALVEAPWDLVIVDEAHHLRFAADKGGNPAYRLVDALAQKSRHLLLLTATPMALDPAEYHALLRLLAPSRFDDPVAFSQVAQRTQDLRQLAQAIEDVQSHSVPLSPEVAQKLIDTLADDADDQAQAAAFIKEDGRANEASATQIIDALRERHALSEFVVRNRRGPVGGLPSRRAHLVPLKPSPSQEALLEVGEDVMLELSRTAKNATLRHKTLGELFRALWATPRALLDLIKPLSRSFVTKLAPLVQDIVDAGRDEQGLPLGDVRLRWLLETMRGLGPDDKLLVFVESAIAVRALKDSMEPFIAGRNACELAVFHRDLTPRDQDRQVAWFRDPHGPKVMLSTEAGGEGRNFQFCHQVVLYDMPWRPATVEQRIGRIDRVGQKRDLNVFVPYFANGYEAAVVKIMQQAVGVLEHTVGGIDHQLEYVEGQLAQLILDGKGANDWKKLFVQTQKLVAKAQERISSDIDPILDFASFSKSRAQEVMRGVPPDLEARIEHFTKRYAEHNHVEMHAKGGARVAVEGAISSAGSDSEAFVATFSRVDAVDHEDIEFLSFGHPLLEQALEWAESASDNSAALALCRGFEGDGAVFLWSFRIDTPEDVPEIKNFMDAKVFTLAIDEAGTRRLDLEQLLTRSQKPLDRMDATPLRGNIERWRALVERNFEVAQKLADNETQEVVLGARRTLDEAMQKRARHALRAQQRHILTQQAAAKKPSKNKNQVMKNGAVTQDTSYVGDRNDDALVAVKKEHKRLEQALADSVPSLVTAVAIRLLRNKLVSA